MKIIGEFQETVHPYRDITILDKNVATFSLEKLNNCSIIDAFKILRYKKNFSKDFFCLYWNGIFKNSPKYLQKIEIRDRWKNYVLMENLIAEYLLKNKKISSDDSWIYTGCHEFSGNRIIAGRGRGIVLSRFLQDDIFKETKSTKMYLRRLEICDLKIFSTIENFPDAEFIKTQDILDFAEKNSSIKPIFKSDIDAINFILWMIIFVLSLVFAYFSYEINNRQLNFKKLSGKISNENISLYLSRNNYESLKTLIDSMDDTIRWNKIAEFCKQNQIKIYQLEIVKNFAKLRTKISLEKLKKLKDIKSEYSVNSEYEQLGTDQTVEATLWIKIK